MTQLPKLPDNVKQIAEICLENAFTRARSKYASPDIAVGNLNGASNWQGAHLAQVMRMGNPIKVSFYSEVKKYFAAQFPELKLLSDVSKKRESRYFSYKLSNHTSLIFCVDKLGSYGKAFTLRIGLHFPAYAFSFDLVRSEFQAAYGCYASRIWSYHSRDDLIAALGELADVIRTLLPIFSSELLETCEVPPERLPSKIRQRLGLTARAAFAEALPLVAAWRPNAKLAEIKYWSIDAANVGSWQFNFSDPTVRDHWCRVTIRDIGENSILYDFYPYNSYKNTLPENWIDSPQAWEIATRFAKEKIGPGRVLHYSSHQAYNDIPDFWFFRFQPDGADAHAFIAVPIDGGEAFILPNFPPG